MKNNMIWRFINFLLTVFVMLLIPLYWYSYGIQNFLWLSDVGLFLTVIALWMNSVLLMSMAAVGIFFIEFMWNVDFFANLIFHVHVIGIADYMFDNTYALVLRAFSLFHVVTPIIWIAYLAQYGYDRRAVYCFTLLYWLIIALTYSLTGVADNINWVFLTQAYSIQAISPLMWFMILFIGFPLFIFLPTHYVYRTIFKNYDKISG